MRDSAAQGARASSSEVGPSTEAIEVVAVMGETVVDVKRCVANRRRRPWLAATAALCLVVSAIAFDISIDRAAENAAALQRLLATHQPSYSFRPVEHSSAIDVVLLAGLGIALLAGVAALLRGRRDETSYRVGTAPRVDLPLEVSARTDFPLITHVNDTFVLTFSRDFVGELSLDDECVSLAELANSDLALASSTIAGAIEIPVPRGAKIRARFGNVIIHAASVDVQLPPSLRPRPSMSRAGLAGISVALVLHGGLLALFKFGDLDDGGSICPVVLDDSVSIDSSAGGGEPDTDEGNGDDDRGLHPLVMFSTCCDEWLYADRPKPTPRVRVVQLDPGRVGKSREERTSHALERAQAIEAARHAGLLDSEPLQASVSSVGMSSDTRSCFDDDVRIRGGGGCDGINAAGTYTSSIYDQNAMAVDAFAARPRFRPDGGGTGWGAICGDDLPTGCRYGTMGHGNGTGEGYGLGSRAGRGVRGHYARTPDVIALGRPTQANGIPVAVLRRYFKRKSDELATCFETALLARSFAAETVVAQFIVAADGSVHNVTVSGESDVATCVSSVVSSIRFPAPDGAAEVSYPLQFRVPGA